MSESELRQLADEQVDEADAANDSVMDLPGSLVAFFASDYILGSTFVAVLDAHDGSAAIDKAFRFPPGPSEHILDPLSYLQLDEPSPVDLPEVDGEQIEGFEGPFGALDWYLVLAERIDPFVALTAVGGWDGDASVAYERDGRACIALNYLGEDRAAAEAMGGALREWASRMPRQADVELNVTGQLVSLVSCDPGVDADLIEGNGRALESLGLPAVRSSVAMGALAGGANLAQARCVSEGLLEMAPYELLAATDATEEDLAELFGLLPELGARCA